MVTDAGWRVADSWSNVCSVEVTPWIRGAFDPRWGSGRHKFRDELRSTGSSCAVADGDYPGGDDSLGAGWGAEADEGSGM